MGKSYDKDREKEMSKEEITVIDKFMKQFQDLEKLKKTDYQSIFNDSQEKITTNGIFRLYICFCYFKILYIKIAWSF